ncbi:MAG: class I SAM-dependent methyltransferase [Lachnospiraceae bacterium]|jgi:SAM-dependent methyltransferase|nr:class I SAM-dependent methyltransferase [Lachnospiraceae bacterium]
MQMYEGFAEVYDLLMEDVPYERWCERITRWLDTYGISQTSEPGEPNIIVELGCGTGTMTKLLADLGYDMIGIDNSSAMLDIANRKKDEHGHDILYLCQDMQEFELYGAVGAFVCVCDSINYLLGDEELAATFRLIHNYLCPGGIFIFDFNTVYHYETRIGNATIVDSYEECDFIWDNFYHPDQELNEYALTFFVKEADGRFRRFQETHWQRGLDWGKVGELLTAAGFTIITAVDDETDAAPHDMSTRIVVVVKRV